MANKTYSFMYDTNVQSDKKRFRLNIASVFQNIGGGTVNHGPLLHGDKNSTRIRGENSRITYPPHQGFHDKNVTFQ